MSFLLNLIVGTAFTALLLAIFCGIFLVVNHFTHAPAASILFMLIVPISAIVIERIGEAIRDTYHNS